MINGPLLSDNELFSSLNDDIPEMRKARELYLQNERDAAVKLFANYVREHYETDKVLSAYSLFPTMKPSEEIFFAANAALEYNLSSVGVYHKFENKVVDWYSNHTENNYEEWTWQFSRHYQLLDVALVYAYSKDERYAEVLFDLIDSWIKQAIRPESYVDGHKTLCWRTLDSAIRLIHWVRILALAIKSPSLTDELILNIYKSVIEHAERLMKKCTDANWLITEMHGLYVTSLLSTFIKDSALWREFAKDKLLNQIRVQSLPDGTHCELTFGYQSVSCNDFAKVYRVGQAFGDEFPSEYLEWIKKYLYTFIKVLAPDNTTPNLNDGYIEDVRAFLSNYVDLFPEDKVIFAAATGTLSKDPPPFGSVLFENAGISTMRDSWGEDAIFAIFDGGKYGKCHNHEDLIRCHQHEDKLNFLMWVGKCPAVSESKNYSYDTSKMRAYSRAAEGHNTILINGLGQNRFVTNVWNEDTPFTKEPIEFEEGEDFDRAAAIYDEGFGENAEKLGEHKRSILFVKKPPLGRPFFIIKDEIKAKEESSVTLIWHYGTASLSLCECGVYSPELSTFILSRGEDKIYYGSEEPFAGWKTVSVKPPVYVSSYVLHHTEYGKEKTIYTLFVPNGTDGKCSVKSAKSSDEEVIIEFSDGKEVKYSI